MAEQQQEEDYTSGPLAERLEHKKWKGRQIAYLELKQKFEEAEDDSDPIFKQYANVMKKIIYDTNVMAMEKGLAAVLAWADRYPNAPRLAGKLSNYLVDKAIAGRPLAKQTAGDILMMLVEREAGEAVLAELIEGTNHKVPKVAAAAVHQITEILNAFGAKVVPVRMILKAMPELFNKTDKNVRAEAMALATSVYQWIGDRPLQPLLEGLRSAQVKELNAAFEAAESAGQPTRLLRSQMEQGGVVGGDEAEEEEEEEEDPLQYLEEKDILATLDDEWYELLQSKKWKERKEQLDKLFDATKGARIKREGDYLPLAKALRTVITKDANVMNVAKAIECVGHLAFSMRDSFGSLGKALLPGCLTRYKEKKPFVISALNETLDIMHKYCFTLSDVLEEAAAAVASKVPTVRAATLEWVQRCLDASITSKPRNRARISKATLKPLAAMLLDALDDSTPQARDAAAKSFGTLVGLIGERPVLPYFNKLDAIKQKKVKEYWPESAAGTVARAPSKPAAAAAASPARAAATSATSAAPSPKPAAPSATPSKRRDAKKSAATPRAKVRTPVSRSGARAAASSTAAASPARKPVAKTQGLLEGDDAVSQASAILAPETVSGLADSNWKGRLEAAQALLRHVKSKHASGQLASQVHTLLSLIAARPTWVDPNMQVLASIFATTELLVEAADEQCLSRGDAENIVRGMVDRIAESKVKDTLSTCLMGLAKLHGPAFVIEHVHSLALAHKSPKVLLGGIQWISSCVSAFGPAALQGSSLAGIVTFLRKALDSSNAQVRSQSISLLGVVQSYSAAGAVKGILATKPEVRASLKSAIEKELAQAEASEPPAPTVSSSQSGSGQARGESSGGAPVDLRSRLKPDTLDRLGARDWATRKSAVEEIDEALTRVHAITCELEDFLQGFKDRINDANKNIACLTLGVLAKLATKAGSGLASNPRNSNAIIPSVLASLADKKLTSAAIACLDSWANACGVRVVLEHAPAALTVEHSAARHELLTWILARESAFMTMPKGFDVRGLVRALISCVEDRSADTRRSAESALALVAARGGVDLIKRQARDLRQASATAVNPLIDSLPQHALYKKYARDAADAAGRPASAGGAAKVTGGSTDPAVVQREWVDPLVALVRSDANAENAKLGVLRDSLREEFDGVVSDAKLYRWMFSVSEEDQRQALHVLGGGDFKSHARGGLEHTDKFLRWVSVLLFGRDDALVSSALSFLVHLLGSLDKAGQHLAEYEAVAFVPLLCFHATRLCTVAAHQQKLRAALRLVCRVFPASKLSALVLRTIRDDKSQPGDGGVAEALLLLRYLVRRQGLHVCAPADTLPLVSAFAQRRSEHLVNAAAGFMAEVWVSMGDKLWEYVPRNDRVERLLKSAKSVPFSYSKPVNAAPGGGVKIAEDDGQHVSTEMMGIWLAAINAGDHATIPAIETLKLVCPHLQNGMIPAEYADLLVAALIMQLQSCFECLPNRMSSSSIRYCKYIINALMSTFQGQAYAEQVSLQCLKDAIRCLLMKLQDARIAKMDEGSHILKALNLLVLKLIENANRSFSFVALIQLLSETVNDGSSGSRYAELLMKCLINITKSLKSTVGSIDLPPVLQEVHNFFETVARVAPEHAMPQKTVKTLLNEIVKLKGAKVKLCMQLVPASPSGMLRTYVDKILEASGEPLNPQPEAADTSASVEEEPKQRNAAPAEQEAPIEPQSPLASSAEIAAKKQLSSIFAELRDADGGKKKALLGELLVIKEAHGALLESFLSKATSSFQEYISTALEELAAERAASQDTAQAGDHEEQEKSEPEEAEQVVSDDEEPEEEDVLGQSGDGGEDGDGEDCVSPAKNTENSNPNPSPLGITPKIVPSAGSSSAASMYLDRLRSLQRETGIQLRSCDIDTSQRPTPVTSVLPAGADAVTSKAAESSSAEASLQSLRARLERVKKAQAESGAQSPPPKQAIAVAERLEALRTPGATTSLSSIRDRLSRLQDGQ